MNQFIQKYNNNILGSLNGFDRLVLRGTLRSLAVTSGMMDFLRRMGILLKHFGAYVEKTTQQLRDASIQEASRLSRPVQYLSSSQTRKEDIARQIAANDRIRDGLICILTCVEPCKSYEIYRDRKIKKLVLMPRERKCLHYYHYWIDPHFGLMHARIQTWFPFTIQVCLNGREWLARQMDRKGVDYERRDNCFTKIGRIQMAQALMDSLQRLCWPQFLDKIQWADH